MWIDSVVGSPENPFIRGSYTDTKGRINAAVIGLDSVSVTFRGGTFGTFALNRRARQLHFDSITDRDGTEASFDTSSFSFPICSGLRGAAVQAQIGCWLMYKSVSKIKCKVNVNVARLLLLNE